MSTYSRPHLKMSGLTGLHVARWRCLDSHGNLGFGATAVQAYNAWIQSVQYVRLANGYYPAPLNLVDVTLPEARK